MLVLSQLHFLVPLLHPHQTAPPPSSISSLSSPIKIPSRTNTTLIPFARQNRGSRGTPIDVQVEIKEEEEEQQQQEEEEEKGDNVGYNDEEDGYDGVGGSGYSGKEEERRYDRDPDFADILGSCLDDPVKAQSKMEERLRKKRNKVLHSKTGSPTPMKVTFNKFHFSNSYIWFEFYNAPLEKDVTLLCDTIRSWHIIGRLGGCNSMNMQLSQLTFGKRPNYDYIQGANVTPTTFYNIGDFEIQDNFARIWVDIGTSEPLLLDVLVNALTQISSDFVGIKQLVFGGSEFENWREGLTSEDAGYSVHKI